jgi:hypothetical protein
VQQSTLKPDDGDLTVPADFVEHVEWIRPSAGAL